MRQDALGREIPQSALRLPQVHGGLFDGDPRLGLLRGERGSLIEKLDDAQRDRIDDSSGERESQIGHHAPPTMPSYGAAAVVPAPDVRMDG